MKAITFLRDMAGKFCSAMSTLFLAYCCVIIVIEVVLRYVFGSGIVWSGASARYAVIWSIMLMGSVLIKDDDLIRADFFDSFLPKSFLRFRDIIYQIITAVIFLMLVFYGIQFAKNGANLNITYTNISIFWAYLAIPVGAAFMTLQFALNIVIDAYTLITGKDPYTGLPPVDNKVVASMDKGKEAPAAEITGGEL